MAFWEEVNEVFFLVPEYGHLNCYTRLSNTLDTSLNSITLGYLLLLKANLSWLTKQQEEGVQPKQKMVWMPPLTHMQTWKRPQLPLIKLTYFRPLPFASFFFNFPDLSFRGEGVACHAKVLSPQILFPYFVLLLKHCQLHSPCSYFIAK